MCQDSDSHRAVPSHSEAVRSVPVWAQLRRIFWIVLCAYCLIVLMLASLQRSMIYLPTRERVIQPDDAGMPRGQVHSITVRTEDQLDLHGWLVLPDGRRAYTEEERDAEFQSSSRVVVFFSGNGGNRTYRPPEIRILTRLGLSVILVDYRGYGENPGSPSEQGLAQDARAAWTYVTETQKIPAKRVLLYGESLGGAVAIRLAADLCAAGKAPAGLILRSTFDSMVDVGAYHYPWLPVRWLLIDRFSSIERIEKVTCPILQIHGRRDTIVPIAHAHRLFDAAPERSRSGVEKQFVELPEADHNNVVAVAGQEIQTAVAELIGKLVQAHSAP